MTDQMIQPNDIVENADGVRMTVVQCKDSLAFCLIVNDDETWGVVSVQTSSLRLVERAANQEAAGQIRVPKPAGAPSLSGVMPRRALRYRDAMIGLVVGPGNCFPSGAIR